jgi:cell division protease FtsH
LEKDADPLHKVSIIPRGPAGGATFSLPERDRMVYTKGYLLATMRVMFGGRISEQVFFNEISSGAAADIKQATDIARHMVREWGMGETVGFVYYGDADASGAMFDLGMREYSDKTAETIDGEIKRIMDAAYETAHRTIIENREKVETIAKALLRLETVTGEEVNALIRGEPLERASVSDLLDGVSGPTVGLARPVRIDPTLHAEPGSGPLPQPS